MAMNGRMMMATGVGLLLMQGCVLPVPFKTLHSSTYQGKVLDAETREPVAKAQVELWNYAKMRDKAKTDKNGGFQVGPLHCWSWIGKGWPYYEGRSCRHNYRGGMANMFSLVVSQNGYETMDIFVSSTPGTLEFIEDILLRPDERK